MKKLQIAPSILSADFARLGDQIDQVERAGADIIHVDVMDGHFVPNITIGPLVVAAVRTITRLPLDVHLMIVEPDRYLEAFASAGADWITVHAEATVHLHRTVARIRELGKRPGVVLNPATPLSAIDEILPNLDLAMLMSVNPGFGGQKFIPAAVDKVQRLREMAERRGVDLEIEVDGGIGPETIGAIAAAGASIFVAGAAVFGTDDYAAAIRSLRRRGGEGTP